MLADSGSGESPFPGCRQLASCTLTGWEEIQRRLHVAFNGGSQGAVLRIWREIHLLVVRKDMMNEPHGCRRNQHPHRSLRIRLLGQCHLRGLSPSQVSRPASAACLGSLLVLFSQTGWYSRHHCSVAPTTHPLPLCLLPRDHQAVTSLCSLDAPVCPLLCPLLPSLPLCHRHLWPLHLCQPPSSAYKFAKGIFLAYKYNTRQGKKSNLKPTSQSPLSA